MYGSESIDTLGAYAPTVECAHQYWVRVGAGGGAGRARSWRIRMADTIGTLEIAAVDPLVAAHTSCTLVALAAAVDVGLVAILHLVIAVGWPVTFPLPLSSCVVMLPL